MCLLCLEIAKSRMTIGEARRALTEMVRTNSDEEQRKHLQELEKASDEELKQKASDFEKSQRGR